MKTFIQLLLFCFLGLFQKGYSQTKNEFAFAIQAENMANQSEEINNGFKKTARTERNFGYGLVYERRFSKHSGVSFGVKYRSALNDIYFTYPTNGNFSAYGHFLVAENFLTVPIQYKFSFPIVSIAAGTSIDYFLSWKEPRRYFYAPLKNYDHLWDHKLSVGLIGSVSKKLHIDKHTILEPTIYYNRILSFERTYFGMSLEIKRKF